MAKKSTDAQKRCHPVCRLFERDDASFVLVTVQFNTVFSIDRLTLDILRPVARFQREVIGRRIRDKFAYTPFPPHKGEWLFSCRFGQ